MVQRLDDATPEPAQGAMTKSVRPRVVDQLDDVVANDVPTFVQSSSLLVEEHADELG